MGRRTLAGCAGTTALSGLGNRSSRLFPVGRGHLGLGCLYSSPDVRWAKCEELRKSGLQSQANITLDAAETRLLERLTTIVTWAGRYPVSIGEEGLVPGAGEYGPADGQAVVALANKLFKLADETPQLIRTGPAGERVEMVRLTSGGWRIQLSLGGKVQKEAIGDKSPEIYATALEWTREFNPRQEKT
jgi:hypothetical protein